MMFHFMMNRFVFERCRGKYLLKGEELVWHKPSRNEVGNLEILIIREL